jgi:hypothetical protein
MTSRRPVGSPGSAGQGWMFDRDFAHLTEHRFTSETMSKFSGSRIR